MEIPIHVLMNYLRENTEAVKKEERERLKAIVDKYEINDAIKLRIKNEIDEVDKNGQ
jgi:hypothetical protein